MDKHEKLQHFYLNLEEPYNSTLNYLREYILALNENITEEWKYGLPFFYLKGKMFCYFWFDKKENNKAYLSFASGPKMDHPALIQGDRKRFKIYYLECHQDLNIEELNDVLTMAIECG